MTIGIRRRGALLSLAVAAFIASCGTVQKFDPSPLHLETIAGADDVIPNPVNQLPTPPAPTPRPPEETYTLVVTDVPVRDVLFALARDAQINVDVSGDVDGRVTINAINQTLPQILDRLSRQVSLRYVLENGTLRVMPDSPFWRNYAIDYVNLARVSEGEVTVSVEIASTGFTLDDQGSGGGSGGGTSGGGGSGANLSSTKVTSLSDNSFWTVIASNLRQIITGQAQNAEGATGGTDPVVVNPVGGVVSVFGNSIQQGEVQTYIDDVLNAAKRQVLIEVTVVEVELNDQYQAGVDWARVSSDGGLGSDGVSVLNEMLGNNLKIPPVFTMTYNNFDADGSGFSATVKLLSQFGNTKVLSSPRIMALNNQTALLKVVDEIVYFNLTQDIIEASDNNPQRTIVTSEIQTVPVGFVMSVTPQIAGNGNVSLTVRPTLTRILDFVKDPAPRLLGADFDNLVPQLHVNEMESLLEVADGQTVVIGGLMTDASRKNTDGIPYLSRLPGIGDLFSYRDDQVKKSELVLFLRPTVVRGAGAGQALARAATPLANSAEFLPAGAKP
jgi:MSHA biogenesis protein MshL